MNCKPKDLLDLNLFYFIGESQSNKKKEYKVSDHEKENPMNKIFGKSQSKVSNISENVSIKRKKEKLIESDESSTVNDQNEEILSLSVAVGRKSIKCPVCNDSFSTIDQIKSHIGSTHFQLW